MISLTGKAQDSSFPPDQSTHWAVKISDPTSHNIVKSVPTCYASHVSDPSSYWPILLVAHRTIPILI